MGISELRGCWDLVGAPSCYKSSFLSRCHSRTLFPSQMTDEVIGDSFGPVRAQPGTPLMTMTSERIRHFGHCSGKFFRRIRPETIDDRDHWLEKDRKMPGSFSLCTRDWLRCTTTPLGRWGHPIATSPPSSSSARPDGDYTCTGPTRNSTGLPETRHRLPQRARFPRPHGQSAAPGGTRRSLKLPDFCLFSAWLVGEALGYVPGHRRPGRQTDQPRVSLSTFTGLHAQGDRRCQSSL
jgi:hypothetical protein